MEPHDAKECHNAGSRRGPLEGSAGVDTGEEPERMLWRCAVFVAGKVVQRSRQVRRQQAADRRDRGRPPGTGSSVRYRRVAKSHPEGSPALQLRDMPLLLPGESEVRLRPGSDAAFAFGRSPGGGDSQGETMPCDCGAGQHKVKAAPVPLRSAAASDAP